MPVGYLSGVSHASRRTQHDGETIGTWRLPWADAPLWLPSSPLRLARARMHTPESECPIMPEEQSKVAPWQRMTIYRYTLPPPYEATEHLFEELPLSTYPSGTTMEPLTYEMEPGAHLGRAAPWTQALVLFPRREPTRMAGSRAIGVSFREACDRGYLRPYDPQRVPDSCQAALVEEAAAKDAQEKGITPRDCP